MDLIYWFEHQVLIFIQTNRSNPFKLMENLSNIGRIFYGTAIAEIGFQTIYFKDFPYFLAPPNHLSIPGFAIVAFVSGALFILAGACIVLKKIARPISLLLGVVLLLVFCFYYI